MRAKHPKQKISTFCQDQGITDRCRVRGESTVSSKEKDHLKLSVQIIDNTRSNKFGN